MMFLTLAAAEVDAPETVSYWRLGALVMMLTGLLALGVFTAMRLRRKLQDPQTPTLDEQVAWFQAMVQRGELSPKEYQRIVAILAEKGRPHTDGASSPHIQRLDDRGGKP